jgi:SAM-dependent methyltransferase
MTIPSLPLNVCVACGSRDLKPSEWISAAELVAARRREDQAAGAAATMDQRSREMLAILPEVIQFYRCGVCGLELASPPVLWSASDYPRDQSYPLRWEFERSVDDLGPEPLDVLELGCGTGHFLAAAAARGHRAVGIDFTDMAVAEAQSRGLRAICGGFDALASHVGPDARFDAVVCFHVIEHLADPAGFLRALEPWLRPGARLFLSCPGPRRFTRLIREQRAGSSDFWDYPPQHVLRWTLPALGALLARCGWDLEAAIEEPFSWVAAGSHVGIARAMYRGELARPVARRVSIVVAWFRLLASASERHGTSIYVSARKHARAPLSGRQAVES